MKTRKKNPKQNKHVKAFMRAWQILNNTQQY